MWLIFIILGCFVYYLSCIKIKPDFGYFIKSIVIDKFEILNLNNNIFDFYFVKELEKIKFYKIDLKKTAPNNLYDNQKIFYALNFLLFNKYKLKDKNILDKIYNKEIKIILSFFDDKYFEFYFDKDLYIVIKNFLLLIQEFKNSNEEIKLNRKDLKCKNCFYGTSC